MPSDAKPAGPAVEYRLIILRQSLPCLHGVPEKGAVFSLRCCVRVAGLYVRARVYSFPAGIEYHSSYPAAQGGNYGIKDDCCHNDASCLILIWSLFLLVRKGYPDLGIDCQIVLHVYWLDQSHEAGFGEGIFYVSNVIQTRRPSNIDKFLVFIIIADRQFRKSDY